MRPPTCRVLPRVLAVALLGLAALPAAGMRGASADERPLVHAIFGQLPDTPEDSLGRAAFAAAAARYHLTPVEVVDVAAPPTPKAGDAARTGILNAQRLAFGEAQRDLDAAAAEVAATGGADLTADELGDLYLYRAMTTAHADWNATAAAAPTDARTRAFDDYLRAATLTPTRAPNPRQLPPQVLADFQRALEVVHERPRGILIVKGSADARISLDGAPAQPLGGGVTFHDVVYGEHLVRVLEVGFAPWGASVPLGQPSLEIDVPARTPLALDDATAAAHARRMGARFALLAQPRGGIGATLELRLVDAGAGLARDAVQASATGEAGQVDAAVMRLDEEARRVAIENVPPDVRAGSSAAASSDATALGPPLLIAPPPPKAHLRDDPAAWTRDHWPLLTAIGVVALTSIVLGAVVGSDR